MTHDEHLANLTAGTEAVNAAARRYDLAKINLDRVIVRAAKAGLSSRRIADRTPFSHDTVNRIVQKGTKR